MSVLRMDGVSVSLPRLGALAPVLRDVSLSIAAGEMLALVGESGSGKTTAALAVPRLLPAGAVLTGGIFLHGVELGGLAPAALRHARGTAIGMVFQDPLAALNPALRVGTQIAEPIRLHTGADRSDAWARAVALLDSVGIEQAALRAGDYPHQFSGGMRQRAVIAGALACGPSLLIADEPTTGLDPVLARQVLELLARLRRERGLAVLLVSHDLAVVGRYADRVIMLRHGAIVQGAPAASQTVRRAGARPPPGDMLRVEQLSVSYASSFGLRRSARPALAGAAFTLRRGECLGVVGASGSGKTTLGRAVLQMVPYSGRVVLDGQELGALRGAALLRARRRIQAVFQDPAGSLDPLMTVADIIGEALVLGGAGGAGASTGPGTASGASGQGGGRLARRSRAAELLRKVGLPEAFLNRRPASLSGGQAQRVAIARALAAEPDLIVLDEPTSSLDAAAQAGLLTLLADLARDRQLGYIVITHDLAVVRRLAHRIAILHQGAIVELEDAETLIRTPRHAATSALIEAANISF